MSITKEKSISQQKKILTVAVAGNPNSGKSTLINAIAGTRLHVGNWPGVTVEKKEAEFEYRGIHIKLVDLPGIYSLSPYSQEEIIARDYLIKNKPDVIIDVVDTTNLERNLYLTVQLLETGIPLVIALNMYDEVEKKGYRLDIKSLEEMLGVWCVKTVATTKKGIDELLKKVVEVAEGLSKKKQKLLYYGEDIDNAAKEVEEILCKEYPSVVEHYPLRWLAYKVMEGDQHLLKEVGIDREKALSRHAVRHLIRVSGDDIESILADARYALVSGIVREVLKRPSVSKKEITEKIDGVVLNRYLGIPIFFISMWFVFKLTFDISSPFVDWLDSVISGPVMRWSKELLSSLGLADWLISLCTDGIIGGVGFVLSFVPIIFAMMFFITFLEGSGYMARAAFIMDRVMHTFGLHGKSFIPLLLGFGCNVPAVYATRTLESTRDRVLTALIIPLMSCGARLPVYVLFVAAFFPSNGGIVLWSLYILGIVMA
ncbi:MAG: ferrous iron transport protein B, partial [Nitrospirae bacterium]